MNDDDPEQHFLDCQMLGLFDYRHKTESIEGECIIKARMAKPERREARHERDVEESSELRAIRL